MTRKQMPSAAQRRVLEAIAAGKDALGASIQTFKACDLAGWIDSPNGTGWRITPLGRDALAQCTAAQGEHSRGVA